MSQTVRGLCTGSNAYICSRRRADDTFSGYAVHIFDFFAYLRVEASAPTDRAFQCVCLVLCSAVVCPTHVRGVLHGSNTRSIGAGKTAKGGGGGSASGDRTWSGCGGSGGLRCFVGTVGIDGLFYSTSTATGEEKEKTPASSTYQAFEAEPVRTGWNDGATMCCKHMIPTAVDSFAGPSFSAFGGVRV